MSGNRELLSFDGDTKNATADVLPIQGGHRSALDTFEQMHMTEAATSPRHYVRSQADGSYRTEV